MLATAEPVHGGGGLDIGRFLYVRDQRLCHWNFMRAVLRQRNTDRVANSIRQERADSNCALDSRVFTFAGFGHAEMNRIIPIWPFLIQSRNEQPIRRDHYFRVRRFHREDERVIIEIARNPREFERALHHAKGRVTVTIQNTIGKRAVIGADAHGDAALLAKIHKWRETLTNSG